MHTSIVIHAAVASVLGHVHRVVIDPRRFDERGQSTAEYALLLLGAATIALLVVSWAAGSGKIGELFDAVVDSIIGKV